MNLDLLQEAADLAVKDYTHFDMRGWRQKVTKRMVDGWARLTGRHVTKLECGTAGCLAGNICIIAMGVKAFAVMDHLAISKVAKALVGLSTFEAVEVFSPFSDLYAQSDNYAVGTKKYAQAIKAGVEKFIAEKKLQEAMSA